MEVHTKNDLGSVKAGLSVSAKSGKGVDELISKISGLSELKSQGNLQILTTRQLNILARVQSTLTGLIDKLDALSNDIIGAELQSVVEDLNELTGEQSTQQIIDSIFRNFCIGK